VEFVPLWPVLITPREESQVLGSFILREKNYVVSGGGSGEWGGKGVKKQKKYYWRLM
jgi:hypothetical protein